MIYYKKTLKKYCFFVFFSRCTFKQRFVGLIHVNVQHPYECFWFELCIFCRNARSVNIFAFFVHTQCGLHFKNWNNCNILSKSGAHYSQQRPILESTAKLHDHSAVELLNIQKQSSFQIIKKKKKFIILPL